MNKENPFLSKDFYVDWAQLTPEKIVPDISLALTHAQKNIDDLCALKNTPEKISFDSVVLGFSRATSELNIAWTRVCHLESVLNTPELRRAYNEILPKVSEFSGGILLNSDLLGVIEIAAKKTPPETLTKTQKRFLEETLKDFHENGADLPPDKKSRLKEIDKRLSEITTKFAENVLDSTNAWEKIIDKEEELAGLPESAKLLAKDAARKKGKENAWRFTLQAPFLTPVMQYAESDDLRKEFWEAGNAIAREGKFDNTQLLREILALRDEEAKLLGFENFADYVTSRRMAKSGANALRFVENMHERIANAFKNENTELEKFAQEMGETTVKKFGKIAPWARGYVAEKMRKEKYDFDEELLRPYFPVNKVIAGAFEIVSRLYGIEIKEKTGVPVWHEDVKVYEVFDNGKLLGAFYTDWHPRETKRSGAWMNALMTRGEDAPAHLGLICGNLSPATEGKPALMSFYEVETIFHEFGHLLHHVLSDVEIPDLAGTNVAWDFVELPSQIMENWCRNAESLALFAKHFETGEPLPADLLEKLLRSQKFLAAGGAMRQLSFGKMDLDFHIQVDKYAQCDLEQYWNETIADYQVPSPCPTISMARKFLHLFSEPTGYAAGYYSYKWAEMLEADCFTRFEKEGVLNPKTGREFREKILSKGDSEPPENLFRDFMGREPDIEPLLKRDGLA